MVSAVCQEAQTDRTRRFLRDYSPSGHLPGGTGNHAGYSGGIVTISERLKGTMSFSVIVVYRSTAMSLLVVWDWNESNWDTDWEH